MERRTALILEAVTAVAVIAVLIYMLFGPT
jgi:hypothetical protein